MTKQLESHPVFTMQTGCLDSVRDTMSTILSCLRPPLSSYTTRSQARRHLIPQRIKVNSLGTVRHTSSSCSDTRDLQLLTPNQSCNFPPLLALHKMKGALAWVNPMQNIIWDNINLLLNFPVFVQFSLWHRNQDGF